MSPFLFNFRIRFWLSSSALRVFFCLVFLFSGCTSVEPVPEMTLAQKEQLKLEKNLKILTKFDLYLNEHKALQSSAEVTSYLRTLAQTLLASSEEKTTNVGIRLVREQSGKWFSFGLPGYTLYLSVDLLKRCKFENEIVALLALHLAHVQKDHFLSLLYARTFVLTPLPSSPLNPLDEQPNQTFTKKENGQDRQLTLNHEELLIETAPLMSQLKLDTRLETELFQFDEKQKCSAVDLAIAILYRSGYDPRGLISLFQIYQKNLIHSPEESAVLDQLVEKTRREIVMYSPLRNPIFTSSKAFI